MDSGDGIVNKKAATALAVAMGGALVLTIVLLFGLSRREVIVEAILPSAGGVEEGLPVLLDGKDVGVIESIEIQEEGVVFRMRIRGVQIREGSEVLLRPTRLRRPPVVEIRPGEGRGVGRFARLAGRVSIDAPDGLLDPPFLLEDLLEDPQARR